MKKQLLLLVLGLLPMLAMADDSGSCGSNLTYTYVSSTGTLTIQGSGTMTNYSSSYSRPWNAYRTNINSVIIKAGVTSIGENAFSWCSELTSVTIPYSVTTIGEYAFYGCSSLPSVIINDDITSIGEYSFYGCGGLSSIIVEEGNSFYNSNNQCNAIIQTSTKTLVRGCKTTIIPNDVKSIGIGAFSSCNDLTSISIPNSVTTIYGGAFDNCSSLISVTIPNSVTSIGYGIFSGCSSLANITIPNSLTSIPTNAFYNCSSLSSITIPNGVILIDSDAFHGCTGLTSITVDAGNPKYDSRNNCNAIIESASNTLIEGCKTTIIPNSVTSIGYQAFSGCSGLTSVTIPNSVTSIGYQAFRDCSDLTSVNSQIESPFAFGSDAFLDISNECVLTVPDGTMNAYIANGWTPAIFKGGIVDAANIVDNGSCGDGVFYIYEEATNTLTIQGSGNMSDYTSSITSQRPWDSYRNDIKIIVVEDGVTSIGGKAFSRCSGLTSITIPNSVTSIGEGAFSRCSGLTSITIPNSVTSIGEGAFYGCSGLTSIVVEPGNSTYDSRNNCNAIIETATNTLLRACNNSVIPNGVTSIGEGAFSSCSGLTSITIPNSVTSIGSGAFSDCSGLTSITIPNSVTTIEIGTFSRCDGLTSITIPNSVTSIELCAFQGCSKLTSITIPNSVTSIEGWAFSDCSGLTSITIPNSVTSIGEGAFYGCSGLISVTIPNSVTSIGYQAFSSCSGLTSITIPNSVTSIGERAFYSCSGLTSVTIPNSVASIGERAFSYCFGLTTIVVENGNSKYDSRNNCNAIIETVTNTLISGCKNTIIHDGVTSIESGAFEGCGDLTSITIPNSVTSIGEGAFYGCSRLTSITIPNSVTSIGDYAFYICSRLTSITISNSVTSIGEGAFVNCSRLTSITIPNSVTSIGELAFSSSGLTSITIPNSVTSIGNYAFSGCSSLTSVTSRIETPFAFGILAFNGISNDCVLTVPRGKTAAYIAAGWTESVFKGGVVESENVSIAMKTGSGADRTMIGYSSQYSLDFTDVNDVRAYIAIGFTDTKNVVMARVNIVPANTGIVLKSDVAGVEVEVPITTSDVYYANLLKPAVNNVTISPTETIADVNYTNLMVGKLANDQMGFVTLSTSKSYSNKCYLQIPTDFYESAASARKGGLKMVFDDETTDIRSLENNDNITNDIYYDLQGRKVIPNKKGLYIHNGKKVFVK